ncbi:TIM barrel protein [Rhabdothermincola sediminis]|uniref:TIM barrel protein n=1 Tax=Rhabdothermincola sediminis TaxID=2751370 RepID=UPI001AA0296F|nr:TIM barrel protein [Rhabdothermincola sediminis]
MSEAPAPAGNPLGVMVPQLFCGPGNDGSTLRGAVAADYLVPHLARLPGEGFGAVELARMHGRALRARVAEAVAGLDVTFGAYVTQLLNVERLHPFDLSHPEERERRRAVERLRVCLREAEQLAARRVGVMSGRDPLLAGEAPGSPARARPPAGGDDLRARHRDALVRSLVELAGETALDVVVMAFDRQPSPAAVPGAYKGALLGPVDEVVEVVARARDQGATNVWVALDTAHLRENGEGPRELAGAVGLLGLLHVSNCVVDPGAPDAAARLGDRHPAFGCPGSAVDAATLAGCARAIAGRYQGPVTFEIRPVGDEDPWVLLGQARAAWEAAVRTVAAGSS